MASGKWGALYVKKVELEKMYHTTTPGTEHGDDHDGPKSDNDGQQGDGYGLSLAPDPRAQKGGHCGSDTCEPQTGEGAKGTSKPAQTGVGKPSYRAFVAAEMRGNGGDLKAAAAKWKSQKGAGRAEPTGQKGGNLLDAIKSVDNKYGNFMGHGRSTSTVTMRSLRRMQSCSV